MRDSRPTSSRTEPLSAGISGRGLALRLFLTCWVVFSLHFATNVVREHYAAFSIIEGDGFRVDSYADLHSDIFRHTDGHFYINNQVTCSAIAAAVLFPFRPVLDALQEHRMRQIAEGGPLPGEYESEYGPAKEFFRQVRSKGLDLRFGHDPRRDDEDVGGRDRGHQGERDTAPVQHR